MINLVPVAAQQKDLFWNINQKYLYEMTNFYPDVMDEQGNYHYGHFSEYFIDPKRKAFFLYHGETMVGFAMINPYSVLGNAPDYTLAEFTIFPAYRRNHYALSAAKLILSTYPGKWEIKYNEKNAAAKALWTAITALYAPTVTHLNENETVFSFQTDSKGGLV